jgi:hypothetical protein
LSGLLQHEIVLLKSCYTAIWDLNEAGLEEQRNEYLKIRERMALHPNKLFVILTSPPANPAETNPQAAANSKRLAEWLSSSNFTEESPNVYVFDLFSLLAVKDQTSTECSMLRPDYRNGKDSHPNQLANQVIVPLLVKFVREAVKSYRQRQNVSS